MTLRTHFRTPVKILKGKFRGQIGFIAGQLDNQNRYATRIFVFVPGGWPHDLVTKPLAGLAPVDEITAIAQGLLL